MCIRLGLNTTNSSLPVQNQYYPDPGYPPVSGTYGLVHDYCGTSTGVPILKYAIASWVHYSVPMCVPNPIDELAVCKYCCVHCTCFRGHGHLRYGCVHEKYDRSFYLPVPTFIYGCVHCIPTREVLILLGTSRINKTKTRFIKFYRPY